MQETSMVHLEIAQLRAESERLRVRCDALLRAYDKDNWLRTADFHGDECDCFRCHMDGLRAALQLYAGD